MPLRPDADAPYSSSSMLRRFERLGQGVLTPSLSPAYFPTQLIQLPSPQKLDMSLAMEELFGDPAYKGFVLQDKKRLPARFFARISGALSCRLRLG